MSNFWREKSLAQLNIEEWDALCDGCGRCCLHKLEDEDSGEVYYTNIACRLLDLQTCRCKNYPQRFQFISDCLVLDYNNPQTFRDLPNTCAYRLLSRGKDLPVWHPLISGDPDSVHEAGISVKGKVISEEYIHPEQYPQHIITWEPAIHN